MQTGRVDAQVFASKHEVNTRLFLFFLLRGEMASPAILSIRDDNQSTITIDTSGNTVSQSSLENPTNQYENYNETRGWDISAKVNAIDSVERTQCQFGYYNNDEFSFNDSTGMIYFWVNVSDDFGALTKFMSMMLCCKLPKVAWSTFGLENTNAGGRWYELTAGEAARNAQQSLAKVICYYMNNHAVEIRQAPVSVPGVNWKDPAYVDADGGVGIYAANFAASNLTFVPGGTNTQVITQNFIEVQVDAGYAASVYFLDGPFGMYNSEGGAFSSGMGNYVRGQTVEKLAFDTTPPYNIARTTQLTPFPYLYNVGWIIPAPTSAIKMIPFYFPAVSTNQTFYDYPGNPNPAKITGPEFAARIESVSNYIGFGRMLPFTRATTLLNSKYYLALCDDLYYGSTTSHNGNARLPTHLMGVLESTADGRAQWGEYSATAISPVQQTSSSMQTIEYNFRNSSGNPLVCASNVAFPLMPPTIPTFVQGDLAHLPDFEWMSMYFESTDQAGTFPIIASPATVSADTFVAAFQTARRPG